MDEERKIEKYDRLMEQRRNAVKKWNKEHNDKVKIYQRKYYELNRENIIKKTTDSRKSIDGGASSYKEYQREYQKKYREQKKQKLLTGE